MGRKLIPALERPVRSGDLPVGVVAINNRCRPRLPFIAHATNGSKQPEVSTEQQQ